MRVNVDHVDPGQRRSLRDRLGLVKNVTLKEDGPTEHQQTEATD
jgi:hypothetical protein